MKIKVFISYSHEPNISKKVLLLSNQLRKQGVDCMIDKYVNGPSEGWPKWMDKQIRQADYVFVVCTKKYYNRSINEDKTGKGVQFETNLTYNDLYKNYTINEKYIPIIFNDQDRLFIPEILQPYSHYNVGTLNGYDLLYRIITKQPKINKPKIGDIVNRPETKPSSQDLYDNPNDFNFNTYDEDSEVSTLVDVQKGEIELSINRDFNSYTKEDQDKLLEAIKNLLELPDDIGIKHIKKGSIKIILELNLKQLERLHLATQLGELKEFGVIDSKLLNKRASKAIKEKIYSYKETLESSITYFKGDELAARVWVNKYAMKDSFGNLFEKTPDDMHHRMANEISRIENRYNNPLSEELIYSVLKNFKYIVPQGGSMTGIGNNNQIASLSNCFVIGNEGDSDSYGGIMKIDQEQVQLMKRRGGVGHDLSHIRPSGSIVLNSALTSTGVVPFMERYSNSAREVAKDGRRGALMLTISIKHPDAENFIDAKLESGKVTGANVSVKITDEFMNAVINNLPFVQQYPVDSDTPRVKKVIDAGKLWEKIINNAWKSAEPGILFWDTIIRESVADCYADLGYKTVATNPCGEIPLCPYDSCQLLALNLYSYVDNPFMENARFNFDLFKEHIGLAQRIMDDVIDLELEKIDAIITRIDSDPEGEEIKATERNLWQNIRNKGEEGRRTGIGITAEGDMIAALGLEYGSENAIDFSEEVHKTLALETYRSSAYLAKERGSFKIYNPEREKDNPFIKRLKEADKDLYNYMVKYGRRNISLLTIAPTGTTSLMTQTTSGIEPVFLPVYKRRRKVNPNDKEAIVSFVDEIGDSWEEYYVFHHKFAYWLKINNYNIKEVKEYSDEKIQEIVEKSPYYKATSKDVNCISKVKIQGRIQKWVDHSISVTINLPAEAEKKLVGELYTEAWFSGCKGTTVYREGSRTGMLITNSKQDEIIIPKRPKILEAEIIRFNNNNEKWIAFVGLKDGKPYEIFTGPADEEMFPIPKSITKGEVVKNKDNKGNTKYDFQYIDSFGYKNTIGSLSHISHPEYCNYAKIISCILHSNIQLSELIKSLYSVNLYDKSLNNWIKGVVKALNYYQQTGTK